MVASKEHNELAYEVTAFDLKLALLQYFRFRRQCICVDEFHGADIIADTGKEIIEIEVKVTKNDLINGEKKKARKHQNYKLGHSFLLLKPNKFLFCVPEFLVEAALALANDINENYGVIAFDAKRLERKIKDNSAVYSQASNYFLRMAKSAKKLHEGYSPDLRWSIAKRASAKLTSQMMYSFKKRR